MLINGKIMKNSELMIFCTSAEVNFDKYLQNINNWYAMLDMVHDAADFYVGVDGKIPKNIELNKNINFIEFLPKYGLGDIPHAKNFAGWKRTYIEMLKMAIEKDYKYVVHIENDVLVLNWEKIKPLFYTSGLFSSKDSRYGFIESAFQILNDISAIKPIIDYYSNEENFFKSEGFEHLLQSKCNFNYCLNSIRVEGHFPVDKNSTQCKQYDFLAQICG
jgi:hypothetical protein